VLWFDPSDVDIHEGSKVIVTTSRGLEYGIATSEIIEVSDQLVADLKSPLQPVVRLASQEDLQQVDELAKKSEEALPVFKQIALETNEDMHPILVEFLFEGDKAVFYFEAEERVDFRELVRRLASHFHVRVDMRQIGVRDGARIIGGLGHCGQELCCKRCGGEFSPVSIRMAKEQNLSLNPQKISGACGRLMCCLRYEYDAYKEFNSRAPKMGAKIETPEGLARVTDINVPSETITIVLEDETTYKIALDDFETPEKGRRPHVISQEVLDRYAQSNQFEGLSVEGSIDVVNFSGEDVLAKENQRASRLDGERQPSQDSRRRRRRRSRSSSEGASEAPSNTQVSREKKQPQEARQQSGKNEKQTANNSSRKPRRTRRGNSSENQTNNSNKSSNQRKNTSQAPRNSQGQGKKNATQRNATQRNAGQQRSARPGQKSSGLSTLRANGETAQTKPANNQQKTGKQNASGSRKPRRRHHTAGGE
jgi:cell fate regulator YaaT (PSP1 superfamily)